MRGWNHQQWASTHPTSHHQWWDNRCCGAIIIQYTHRHREKSDGLISIIALLLRLKAYFREKVSVMGKSKRINGEGIGGGGEGKRWSDNDVMQMASQQRQQQQQQQQQISQYTTVCLANKQFALWPVALTNTAQKKVLPSQQNEIFVFDFLLFLIL